MSVIAFVLFSSEYLFSPCQVPEFIHLAPGTDEETLEDDGNVKQEDLEYNYEVIVPYLAQWGHLARLPPIKLHQALQL